MRHTTEKSTLHRYTVSSYTCSRCGAKCDDNSERGSIYHTHKVRLYRRTGTSYPEGGGWQQTIFDCCLKCFEEAAKPALIQAGFEPREEETDW